MKFRARIVLAEDHAMLRDAFRRLLEPRHEVLQAVADGRSLVEAVTQMEPDIVLLDISMPLLNGVDAGQQIQKRLPKARLIYLTVNEDPDLAAELLRRGAAGYLIKNSASSELFTAIDQVLAGNVYLTPLLAKGQSLEQFLRRQVPSCPDKLTPRQREVLQLLAEGYAMKQVADRLNLTPRTVAFHKYTTMEHLGIKTSAELVQYAVKHGLVSP